MATAPTTDFASTTGTAPRTGTATLLVCLPSMPTEAQAVTLNNLAEAFPGEPIAVAGATLEGHELPDVQSVEYASTRSPLGWVLAAGDYSAAAATAAQLPGVSTVLLMSADASSLPAASLREMVASVRSGIDLAVPRYPVGPHDALVSSALMYPLSRALFSADIRFPLPVDAALSPRLLPRLATVANRVSAQGPEALIWPVSEAAIASQTVRQVDTPERTLPTPPNTDLNSLLASVAGSLFADIEAKATYWQRGRAITPTTTSAGYTPDQATAAVNGEVMQLIEGFRLASANLTEIWSLVLPPQTLLAIKKLSRATPEMFAMDSGLWARIVYDFALAFHLRTLNRGHLLGAMTPLYLAWVGSHIRAADDDAQRALRLTEATAQAFEREKPYFVSRWRWPDRFNP